LPILDALGRLGRGPHGKELLALLRRHAPLWLMQLPSLLDTAELQVLQRNMQHATRERMLREMAEALEALTLNHPVVLVLEDLHWSDVSTLDLLAFIARRKQPARFLVIGTYRPVEMLTGDHPLKGIVQELYAHRLAIELALGVLSRAEIETYLAARCRVLSPLREESQGEGRAYPPHLARTLHLRTGGNPLFLVSLVNDLIERGVFRQTDTGWELKDDVTAMESAAPDAIRHLVARQSGRLPPEERLTLEAASVAGMEFSAAAVAAALTTDTVIIERRCEQLAERQQFLQCLGVEDWPDGTLAARYRFLHALYQQLWHERVSPTQLQHFHLRIGWRKERAYGERAREIATELAVHFEQGRDYRKAVQYLRYAGTNALQCSAHHEAIGLLTKGLEILQALPDTSERIKQELRLQVALSPPLQITKGFAAPEVENVCARIQELCQQVEDVPLRLLALAGLHAFSLARAKYQIAYENGEQILRLAQTKQDRAIQMQAHTTLGTTSLWLGEFIAARTHLEQVFALDDPRHPLSAQPEGLAARRTTGAESMRPYYLTLLAEAYGKAGRPEEGLRTLAEALALIDKTEERWCEAELWRLKGELTLQKFQVSHFKQVPSNSQSL